MWAVAVTEDGPSSGAGEVAAAAEEATEAAGDVGGFKANVGMYWYCGGGGAAPGSFFLIFKKDVGKDAPTPPPIVLFPLTKRYFNIFLFIFNFSNY